jgi:hypothetical protein
LDAVVGVILVMEEDLVVFKLEQAMVADRHAMRVARQVFQYLLRPAEGPLGVDDPFCGKS